MNAGQDLNILQEKLAADWQLQMPSEFTEEALLEALAARIATLISREPEYFFQAMYRLDISEEKLRKALLEADAPAAIAKLVWERQLQKMQSRNDNRPLTDDDKSLAW